MFSETPILENGLGHRPELVYPGDPQWLDGSRRPGAGTARRAGYRGTSAKKTTTAAVALTPGLSGFSTTNYYLGPANEGPRLAIGVSRIVAIRLDSLPGTTFRLPCSAGDATSGWYIGSGRSVSVKGVVNARGTTARNIDFRTWVAGDVGKCFTLGYMASAGTIEGTLQGVSQGVIGGGTFADGAVGTRFAIGVQAHSITLPADHVTIIGFGSVSSTLTAADMLTWHNAIVAAGRMVASPVGTTSYLYDTSVAGATWVPTVGVDCTMPRTGTLTRHDFTPAWGTA